MSSMCFIAALSVLAVLPTGSAEVVVPKLIWSYWHDHATIPKTVELAAASWRANAPGYEVRFLDSQSWTGFFHEDWASDGAQVAATTTIALFTDWLRLSLLTIHGGVWIDASIILIAPLRFLINETTELSGVHLSGMLFEPYLISAIPRSKAISRWREEFQKIVVMDESRYDEHLLDLILNGIEPLNGQFSGCGWKSNSGAHVVVHAIYQSALRLVNRFSRHTGVYLHPCGQHYWMRYLKTCVAMNSALGTSGEDPRPLWERYGISVQDTSETLSAVAIQHDWNETRSAEFLMTRQSSSFDLHAHRGLKLRSKERNALEAMSTCEASSVICRVQEATGARIFSERGGDAHEGGAVSEVLAEL